MPLALLGAFVLPGALLGACAGSIGSIGPLGSLPDPETRTARAAALAEAGGFQRLPDTEGGRASGLPVAAWLRPGARKDCLRVYLEGDGLAWRTRWRSAADPTPVDPVGLRLALADASNATLVYLARPCQLGGASRPPCRPLLWTAARYGEEVLQAVSDRLDGILPARTSGAGPAGEAAGRPISDALDLTLVGYSGGGVLAALLAAHRDDVDRLVTIAAPLDLDHWTEARRVSPLRLSLSPMQETDRLRGIPQLHFVSEADGSVPVESTERFHEALRPDAPSRLHRIEGVGHADWPDRWRAIRSRLGPHCGAPSRESRAPSRPPTTSLPAAASLQKSRAR